MITTNKGLRQGRFISPTLIKTKPSMGITVDENILFTLVYEDDRIVVAEDAGDLSYMM